MSRLNARIHDWVQNNRTPIMECLGALVALETINHASAGNEANGQSFVAATLRSLGCETDVYEIASVPGLLEHPRYWAARPCLGRPNVTAIRRGAGGGKSLLISSHIDTVGPGPDAWKHDPWGEIADGNFYGLGAYDMKGGLAASLLTVRALNDLNIALNGDLLVESVVDEEGGGCNGSLAARLKYNADLAIIPEPTDLAVCPAHLGALILRVTFRGRSGIGITKPLDPTPPLARFIGWLQEWARERRKRVEVPAIYADDPNLNILVTQLQAGDVTLNFMGDRVPSSAWVNVVIAVHPGTRQNEILADLQNCYAKARQSEALLRDFEPEWEVARWLDGSAIPADDTGVQTLAREAEAVRGQGQIRGAGFQCDGHIFNLASPTPALIFGPKGGGAHAPDEHIEIEAYLDFVEILIRTSVAWCGVAA